LSLLRLLTWLGLALVWLFEPVTMVTLLGLVALPVALVRWALQHLRFFGVANAWQVR